MTAPSDYDELLRENTRGLLFRDADNLSDWTTGTEWQERCAGCLRGVWAEDATEVDDERFCEACVVEMNHEFEEAMAR